MKIVIIGGTGLVGSKVVSRLRELGHDAVPASPDTGVNTLTGEGLREVLEGAAVVADVSNSPSFEDEAVMKFFTTSTANLLEAEAAAGVRHHVALSVVGSERMPDSGYFRAKVAQEAAIAMATIPYTIVRATQFYEFMGRIADAATDGVTVRLAPVSVRPIATDDVARALADVCLGAPANGTVEIAGPRQYRLDELVRYAIGELQDPREVIADTDARYFGARLETSTLIPDGNAALGAIRFEDWLGRRRADRVAATP